jgi:hypothetical protein
MALSRLNGIPIYKLRRDRSSYVIGLPKELCEQLGFSAGADAYFAVRAVGPCLVICQITDLQNVEAQVQNALHAMHPSMPWFKVPEVES